MEEIACPLMWGLWWQGICISADKAFCSQTVFTEPFRLPSARGGMGPAFIMHRESSLIWGIASALFSPPHTPIHTRVQLCSPRQRETKLPLMLWADGNKMVTFVQTSLLKDLPSKRGHRQMMRQPSLRREEGCMQRVEFCKSLWLQECVYLSESHLKGCSFSLTGVSS